MKKGFLTAAPLITAATVIVAMPSASLAQPPSLTQLPSPTVAQTSEPAPASQPAKPSQADAVERRRNIRYMEGVLAQAIRVGAEQVGKELERYDPSGITVLLGTPRARGFVIDQHGVFFDVEVPDMNQSLVAYVVGAQRDRQLSNAADSLREAVRALPEGPAQQRIQVAIQTLDSYGTKDTVVAQNVPRQIGAVPAILSDPRAVYREAVVNSVIDAMLVVQMSLGPDEWLTVAARGTDAAGPLQGVQETTTIMVRVKGSELATYHSDPSRRAEIRQKVKADVKVF